MIRVQAQDSIGGCHEAPTITEPGIRVLAHARVRVSAVVNSKKKLSNVSHHQLLVDTNIIEQEVTKKAFSSKAPFCDC
jgi:hypothetical protein